VNLPVALVLDSSVFLKWFLQEEILADCALRLRQFFLAGSASIQSPTLALYEFSNALRYKNDWTLSEIQQAITSLWNMGIRWSPTNALVMKRAVEIARQFDITIYDATFIALAQAQDCLLITADQKLLQRVGGLDCVKFLGDVRK